MKSSGRRILVVAAHPDDEVLGCGGAIAKHADYGDEVYILIVAEGATSRQAERKRSQVSGELNDLKKAAYHAGRILGATGVELLNLPDNRLDSLHRLDLIKQIEERVDHLRPETVYTHHAGDVNIDHRRLHEAVVTSCRPMPGQPVKQLLSFEVASSTEWQTSGSAPIFVPNWYVDISAQWSRKRDALLAYASEMRPWPHARSHEAIEHLVRLRGSQVGVNAAEAFCLLRQLG